MTIQHDKENPVEKSARSQFGALVRRQLGLLKEAYDLFLCSVGWKDRFRSVAPKATWSLRKRLLAMMVGGSLVLWGVSLAIIVHIAWDQTSEVFDDGLKAGARLILDANEGEMPRDGVDKQGPKDYERVPLDYQIVVGGKVVRRTGHAPEQSFVSDLPVRKSHVFRNVFSDGQLWRVYVLRSFDPAFEVQIAQPYSARLALLKEFSKNLLWPAFGLFVLITSLTWFSIQRLLRPLDDTARAIASKSPTDLTPLQPRSPPAELMPIVDALNRVFSQLSHAMAAEKRFTADAAHELRTPLAALRMKTQLLQRQYPGQHEILQPLRDDADRCTALIENLLMLARLDHPDSLERRDIDVLSMAQALAGSRASVAAAKHIVIDVSGERITLSCNEDLLRIALRNLIDNALMYCSNGSMVSIEISTLPGHCTIKVVDDGPGVASEFRQRLTERFFRVLGSGAIGNGLGLSIVSRVAVLHGGNVDFSEGIGGQGLGVAITLPTTAVARSESFISRAR